jgi:hypothetical protein
MFQPGSVKTGGTWQLAQLPLALNINSPRCKFVADGFSRVPGKLRRC